MVSFLERFPEKKDSTGSFIQFIVSCVNLPIHAFMVEKRFDIGNLSSCIDADSYFKESLNETI